MTADATPFGPSGKVVYDRTYARAKADGTKETWPETVERVANGNLALVYGTDQSKWSDEVLQEADDLKFAMSNFSIIPAGRHLWATGAPGRQYLFNCHTAGWGKRFSEHFTFTFLRLMEGGGVGTNYSLKHVRQYGQPKRKITVKIVSHEEHPDFKELSPYLSPFKPGILVADTREGWADALGYMLDLYMGSDAPDSPAELVFNVSGIRPSGSPLVSSGGTASGPAPFAKMMLEVADIFNSKPLTGLAAMEIDHAIAECVVAGGNRRSARMSIMHWNDPEIFTFINAKQDTGKHWTTNISVEIDSGFFRNLKRGNSHASNVMFAVTTAMLENGEPGFWNSGLSGKGEHYPPIATNPCGEIALEPWENCNLGHVNLDWFYDKDLETLSEAHRLMTRFLIRATYGDVRDSKQRDKLAANRRIGVGHLGVQGYWAKKGIKYSNIPVFAPIELRELYGAVRKEAKRYAKELGIPEPVKVTTVAPTGSVAKLPGVSEGIHPIYARWFEQRIRFTMRDEAQFATVLQAQQDGFTVETDQYDASGMTKVVVYPTENILMQQVRELGFPDNVVESTEQLTIRQMLNVQEAYQAFWADNAVSYTVNILPGTVTQDDLAEVMEGYLPFLKGTTIMVDASRPQAPYTRITEVQYKSAVATRIEDSTDLECSTGACPVK